MRSIAICDDDPRDLDVLRQMTADYLTQSGLDLTVETFLDGATLLKALTEEPERYILLLMDILLGAENGVELAKLLRKQNNRTRLVFISSSPEFALEGYKVNADDYLVKPLSAERFAETLDRISSRNTIVSIETSSGIHMVQVADIRYIESDGHYVTVVTQTEKLRSRCSLSEMGQRLRQYGFFRCQKSFLVNITHVRELLNTDLVLSCGTLIPVGRQYHNEIESHLVEYAALRLPSLL